LASETTRLISLGRAHHEAWEEYETAIREDPKRVGAIRDEDIRLFRHPKLGSEFFADAILWAGPKKQITLRVDPDVLTFFRKHVRYSNHENNLVAVLSGDAFGDGAENFVGGTVG
jgi:uncharacterized protein (DUF4415 family)